MTNRNIGQLKPSPSTPDLKTPDLKKINHLDNLYSAIFASNTFASRAQRGQNANVIDLGDGWVKKSDKSGSVPLAAREYAIMAYLDYERDTGVTPKIDVESGFDNGSFIMEKINNGSTLEDWFISLQDNPYTADVLPLLLNKIHDKLVTMWEAGVVHGDLHCNNIVVGRTNSKSGLILEPKIIDFGFSEIDEKTLAKVAKSLGIKDEVSDSEYYFQRQVLRRFEDPSGDLDFFESEMESYMHCPDVSKYISEFKDKLGKSLDSL
jgi:serine/threonine protein kinase